MADQITLKLDARDTLGKGVKRLRKDGVVPCVIHDHGKESTHVQAEYQTLYKVFVKAGKHHPVDLTVGDTKFTALIKHVTFDPRLGSLTHVVFNAVKGNEKVDAEIPVRARYAEGNENSPAERAGLIVLAQLDVAQVKALPRNLPDELTYDAEKLVAVGDQVTIADLDAIDGVEVQTEAEHVVATVFEPSALAAANEAAAGDAEDAAPADETKGGTEASTESQTESTEEK
ncbi:MAG: 50S ribosomal protein L25 [Candidatus Saccharimonadales bacterium]